MTYPRHQLSRAFRYLTNSAGHITVNTPANTWQELAAESGGPGTGVFDLTIEAEVGDVIEGGFQALISNSTPDLYMDIKTIVAGAPVGSFVAQGATSATAPPCGPWFAPASTYQRFVGSHFYTILSGDIATGRVTFRPYAMGLSATNRLVFANTDTGFMFYVKNLGPPDPE
jgi:hypothetical protein